jgi:hypothetical protein
MNVNTVSVPARAKQLKRGDLKVIFEFFNEHEVDYGALRALVGERFADNPILLQQCMAFADSVEAIESGRSPDLKMQLMIAKTVLNMIVNIGRVATAKAFLEACCTKWDRSRFLEADTMLTMSGEDIEQLDVLDKPWLDYQVFDRKADTTMMLFCGHAHRFGVDLNAVALWLRSLPVNLIYLRDFNIRLYLAGVQSIGNIEQSVDRIKQDLSALGTKRIVTMGNSGGVYGALHYGCLLDADEILCFAGPTSLHTGVLEASERPAYDAINSLVQQGELKEPDLRKCLIQKGISVRYFYGEHYEFDAAQVETLKNIPNVSIEPVTDWDRHVVIGEMARRHQLKDILLRAATG